MAWDIETLPAVRPLLQLIDPLLRAEMVEKTAEIADDPLSHLRRAYRDDEFAGARVLEYDSDVIHGLRVRLLFDLAAAGRPKLFLMAVLTTSGDRRDQG